MLVPLRTLTNLDIRVKHFNYIADTVLERIKFYVDLDSILEHSATTRTRFRLRILLFGPALLFLPIPGNYFIKAL
jgi:hypothetical protein